MKLSVQVRIGIVAGLLGVLALSFQNCGPAKFESLSSKTFSGGQGECNNVTINTTQQVKIIFMVDNSQSTRNVDCDLQPDKTCKKPVRVNSVKDFLAVYGSKPNFKYAFGWFSSMVKFYDFGESKFETTVANSGKSKIETPILNFLGDAAQMSTAADVFEKEDHDNGTLYENAFLGIIDAIKNDNLDPKSWRYAITFVSDGIPTDDFDDKNSNTGALEEKKLRTKSYIEDVLNAAAQKGTIANVSTVYLGPANKDTDHIDLLKDMAVNGHGVFVDTNSYKNQNLPFDLSDAIIVPGDSCQ